MGGSGRFGLPFPKMGSARRYNGQAAESRTVDTVEDIPYSHTVQPPVSIRCQPSKAETLATKPSTPKPISDIEKNFGEELGGDVSSKQELERNAKTDSEYTVPKVGGSLSNTQIVEEESAGHESLVLSSMGVSSDLRGSLPPIDKELPNTIVLGVDDIDRGPPILHHHVLEPEPFSDELPRVDRHENSLQNAFHVRDEAAESEVAVENPAARTIHILGTGPIGKFIAHSLAGVPNAPPVTLLMHRPLLIQQWHDEGEAIRLLRNGKLVTKSQFNVELSAKFHRDVVQPSTKIRNIIVATEGYITVSALAAIKHRLGRSSSICFIQDGLGVVDHVNSSIFPDLSTRPNYILGNMSHDLQSTESKFTVVERRAGKINLTMIPREVSAPWTEKAKGLHRRMDFGWAPSSRYLLRTLCRVPELSAIGFKPQDYYKAQLEKLAINSIIGPLSVIYDCPNDQLLHNYQVSRTMKVLLKEISMVLISLPEVSRVAAINKQFSAVRLERLVLSVIGKTGKNRTSMLQAIRDGEKTNIDFYNGYLLGRAAELGIDCPCLGMIVSMVKGKQAMKSREKNSYIPFQDDY